MIKVENYFKGDSLAATVWKGKYAVKGEETPDDMHRRMAREFARIEKNFGGTVLDEDTIYELFRDFKYIVPQGSIMSMLGNKDAIGSLSNCFVIGQPYDSYGGILQKDQQLVQLMKRRGGVGIDISTLRCAETPVSNAAGTSTGAISFMHRYSNTTREVAQNGRRGALMISIDCRHPDVLDFINIKADLTKVTGANISVKLRDDFMNAVKNNEDYILRFPCDIEDDHDVLQSQRFTNWKDGGKYNELYTISKDFYFRKVKARDYFQQLVHNNWLSAEPGSIFVDRHWNYSPDGVYPQYKGVTTNPCGEIFMQMYDACRLLALNLFSLVEDPFSETARINYDKLYEVAYIQQKLADDLVDLELEHIERILDKITTDPEPEEVKAPEYNLWQKIYKTAKAGRRTGCGFTGLGDMLAALSLKYDSDEAKDVIERVMSEKLRAELDCTIDLGIERGTFEGWDWRKEFEVINGTSTPFKVAKGFMSSTNIDGFKIAGNNDFYQMLAEEFPDQTIRMLNHGRRNVSWSTVAPTGTVSLLTQTTSGLEPLFAPFYFRNKKGNPGDKDFRSDFVDQSGDHWMTYPVLHPKFRDWIVANTSPEDLLVFGLPENWTKELLNSQYENSPWYQSCANDIDWTQRVDVQSIIQRYTTHSISSTINLPKDVTEGRIAEIYMSAWEKGLKGVTVYRDGCRTGVLITDNEKEDKFEYHDAPKRPDNLPCEIFTTTSKGKKWNIIVGLYDDKPYEVFAVPHFTNEDSMILRKLPKGRYDLILGEETYHKDITRDMTDEESALTRLISTALRHGSSIDFIVEQLNKSHGTVVSFNKAIARILTRYAKKLAGSKEKCSDCGSESLVREEGCLKCNNCGSSKCG